MRVERIMAVMMAGDRSVGYIKGDRIDDRLTLSLDIGELNIKDAVVIVRVGDKMYTISAPVLVQGYNLDVASSDVSGLSAVVLETPSGHVIAEGSRNGRMNAPQYMPIFEDYISQNSGTYIGVKSHLHDMASESDDGVDGKINEVEHEVAEDTIDDSTSSTEDNEDKSSALEEKTAADIFIDKVDNVIYSSEKPFYEAIGAQLEDLFSRYEREDVLENAIEGSRFAKIYYEDDLYYVVGEVMNDEGTPDLICYGYPGEQEDKPPNEVKGSYEWIPLDRNNDKSRGYYMMYQNALTGDIIEN